MSSRKYPELQVQKPQLNDLNASTAVILMVEMFQKGKENVKNIYDHQNRCGMPCRIDLISFCLL